MRPSSWLGLHEEMKLDMQRIWKRNLGRDDRCIADNGKEARFPFLDEDVIRTLLDIPLWEIANLDQPSGIGDNKILRELVFSIDDLKAALGRRGPDSLDSKKVFLYSKTSSSIEEREIVSFTGGEEAKERDESCSQQELHFIGATLQLRGINPIVQPLVDTYENIFVYNGEIFGGINIDSDSNDTEILIQALGNCCSCNSHLHTRTSYCLEKGKSSVPEVLFTIKGPWAVIYWQVTQSGKFKNPVVWSRCIRQTEPSCSLAYFGGPSVPAIFCITIFFH